MVRAARSQAGRCARSSGRALGRWLPGPPDGGLLWSGERYHATKMSGSAHGAVPRGGRNAAAPPLRAAPLTYSGAGGPGRGRPVLGQSVPRPGGAVKDKALGGELAQSRRGLSCAGGATPAAGGSFTRPVPRVNGFPPAPCPPWGLPPPPGRRLGRRGRRGRRGGAGPPRSRVKSSGGTAGPFPERRCPTTGPARGRRGPRRVCWEMLALRLRPR
jgi:hypothetical protein